MTALLEVQVTLSTEMNMGDHAERVRIAHRVEPGETVEHLLMRLMGMGEFQLKYRSPRPASDWIEIRYVEGTASTDAPESDLNLKGRQPF
jgi:hypothetical protein